MQNGNPVVNLSVATSESWRDKATGEKKEKTEWHRVVIFNKNLAEVAEKYLRKGSKVYLEGSLPDPQMDRQGRGREIHRSRAAEFQRHPGDAGRPQRRRRRWPANGLAPAKPRGLPARREMDDEIFLASIFPILTGRVRSSSGVPATVFRSRVAAAYIPLHRGALSHAEMAQLFAIARASPFTNGHNAIWWRPKRDRGGTDYDLCSSGTPAAATIGEPRVGS